MPLPAPKHVGNRMTADMLYFHHHVGIVVVGAAKIRNDNGGMGHQKFLAKHAPPIALLPA